MNTLPVWLSALFLVAAGAAFLWAARCGHRTGELRAGTRGFRAFRPRRAENPLAFHVFMLLYVVFGSWLVIRGIQVAMGHVPPLPFR